MRLAHCSIALQIAGGLGWLPATAAAQSATCVCPGADATCSCPNQPAGSAAYSAAFGLGAHFKSEGVATRLGRIAFVQGSAPPAYSRSAAAPGVSKTLAIVPDTFPTPTLFVNAINVRSHVASRGIEIDSISSAGDAKLNTLGLTLNLNPPPPTANGNGPVPQPFLALSATDVASSASFDRVFPSANTTTGSASFGSLSITGSLVGDKTLTFSGVAPRNTVLFQSATVTITLDEQVQAGLVTCDLTCHF
ncbi:MAG: hypothetical protein JO047_02345, partial [Alphaproteobacteria bacterium]|nr:hypothetical protein [Alphaproteobacteria bacterium]